MSIDLEKLLVYFIEFPGIVEKDDVYVPRDKPDYDEEKGPVLYRMQCDYTEQGREPRAFLSSYPIISYTACGVWIGRGMARKKFINLRAERQWASVTKAEAFYHLKCRKSRQLQILNWKQQMCEEINQYLKIGSIF